MLQGKRQRGVAADICLLCGNALRCCNNCGRYGHCSAFTGGLAGGAGGTRTLVAAAGGAVGNCLKASLRLLERLHHRIHFFLADVIVRHGLVAQRDGSVQNREACTRVLAAVNTGRLIEEFFQDVLVGDFAQCGHRFDQCGFCVVHSLLARVAVVHDRLCVGQGFQEFCLASFDILVEYLFDRPCLRNGSAQGFLACQAHELFNSLVQFVRRLDDIDFQWVAVVHHIYGVLILLGEVGPAVGGIVVCIQAGE